MESYVKIIIPCKSEKLNKTGDYLLVTDSTIDGETLRLGDSDLLIKGHPKLVKLVKKKQRRCRQVSVVLGEIHRAVRRLIQKFLGINIFKPSCCGNKWPFRMFRKYLHNDCYLWLLIESLCSIWNAIEKFCIWKVIKNFEMKVCSSIALSNSKSFLVCLSTISHTCIFLCAASWIVKVRSLFMWFFVIWFNFQQRFYFDTVFIIYFLLIYNVFNFF